MLPITVLPITVLPITVLLITVLLITMKPHAFVLTQLLLSILLTGLVHAAPAHPNVLFIAIDDLNDWVGCFGGNPQVKTPNLDRFAAEGGMVMMNAHVPATVCCPSRSALLTGVHATRPVSTATRTI